MCLLLDFLPGKLLAECAEQTQVLAALSRQAVGMVGAAVTVCCWSEDGVWIELHYRLRAPVPLQLSVLTPSLFSLPLPPPEMDLFTVLLTA